MMNCRERITLFPFTVLCCLVCCIQPLAGQEITFSEIMYDVKGPDYHDEFIEVFNLSESEEISLEGWTLMVDEAEDLIICPAGTGILKPRRFALILDASYTENSELYERLIPDSVLVLTTSDKAFGKSGLPNGEAALLKLMDTRGNVRDTCYYSTGNPPGHSDEKIRLDGNHTPENWSNSIQEKGTPGWINSVSQRERDPSLPEDALIVNRDTLLTGKPVQMSLLVRNNGLSRFASELDVLLFMDSDGDSLPGQNDQTIIRESKTVHLQPGDSLLYHGSYLPNESGIHVLAGMIASVDDENPYNNRIFREITINENRQSLCISEIRFLTHSGEPEWVELLNYGEEPVTLRDWCVSDTRDTCRIDTALRINPGEFQVLSAGKDLSAYYPLVAENILVLNKFPGLNNDGDVVSLIHPVYGVIEAVPYQSDWLEDEQWRNPSLERLRHELDPALPSSWGPCMHDDGATPGAVNSIHITSIARQEDVCISPDPFSPDGDGFEDHTLITIRSEIRGGRFKAVMYDIGGRRVRTLEDNRYFPGSITLSWDGRSDEGNILRMGIYVLFIQIIDDRSGIKMEIKETITLARPL